MLKRIISAVIGIGALLGVICLSLIYPICIDILVSCASTVAVYEFMKAIRTLNIYQISVVSLIFAFAYPMLSRYDVSQPLCFVYTGIMLSMLVFFNSKITFKNFAYTFSITLIIAVSLSTIVMMKNMDRPHSTLYFVFALAIPWFADGGAYFVGVLMGKHKLCPNISPKKTVEGFFGGVVVCMLATFGLILLFDYVIYGDSVRIDYFKGIIIGIGGSLLSVVGDLSFSVIKRSYKVKDYGDVIPGHGGILDRIDSVICFAPFLYLLSVYLPFVIK